MSPILLPAETSTLPIAALTAWFSMVDRGLREGARLAGGRPGSHLRPGRRPCPGRGRGREPPSVDRGGPGGRPRRGDRLPRGRATAEVDLLPMLFRPTRLQGIAVGHREAFEAMNRFIEAKRIKPVIDSTYPFADAIEAFEHLGRGAFGTIVIDVAG